MCWLTGRSDPAVEARALELGVTRLIAGSHDKADALQSLSLSLGVSLDAIAYVGDDLLDLPAIRLAGLTIAPCDAEERVRAEVDWVSELAGGQGVVRWVCDQLIAANKEKTLDSRLCTCACSAKDSKQEVTFQADNCSYGRAMAEAVCTGRVRVDRGSAFALS